MYWNEKEFGAIGGNAYYEAHKQDAGNYSIVMESDSGTFTPLGLQYSGPGQSVPVLQQIMQLLAPINASELLIGNGEEGADIQGWTDAGVPSAALANQNENYFWFHHSNGT